MAKFRKNLIVSENNFSGTGIMSKISFSGKFYLALSLLAIGLLIQSVLFWSCLYEYRTDLMNHALSRRSNDEAIMVLRDLSQDLHEKIIISNRAGILIDLSEDLNQISRVSNNLRNNLESNFGAKQLNKIERIVAQLQDITPLTSETYQMAVKLNNQYHDGVNRIDLALSKQNQSNYREIIVILLIKFALVFLLLLLEIVICKWLVRCAIRSIDEPAGRIIRCLQGANGDLQVKLPICASEGLGTTGLILNDAILKWHSLALEFKNASNKLNYQVDELASGFDQVFLLEVQLREAYLEVESNLNDQQHLGKRVNEEIKILISNLSGLQYLPRKVSEITGELNSLLTVNRDYLNGVIDRHVEVNNESHDIMVFLRDLGATSGRVNRITKELGEIEEESEMLAFNSAISAARAGEEGQGFSVVAKEIANLVERSKKASNNLSGLIGEIQLKVEQIVGLIPENGVAEPIKLSLDKIINSVCLNLNETADQCLNELNQMRHVTETIFMKSNETFEEIDSRSDLPQVETGALAEIKNSIARYLESVKHTIEIKDKIYDTVNSLQTATDQLINRNV